MNDKQKAQAFFQDVHKRLDDVYDLALGALDSAIVAVDGYMDRVEKAVLAKIDEQAPVSDGYPDTYAMCADIGRSNEFNMNFSFPSAWTRAAESRTGFDAEHQRNNVKDRWDKLDPTFKTAK